jgi:DNA polymerase III sliding clamp (beta) subunit (PCNA family)
MKIPQLMILDRDPQDQAEVLNIQLDENTLILHALEDVTVALLDGEFPSGTLVFKAGQVIMLPLLEVDMGA